MFAAAIAQLRFAVSVGFGRRFDHRALERLADALEASRNEFGPFDSDVVEAVSGPVYPLVERRQMQLRRFTHLLRRAVDQTEYYRSLLERAGLSGPDIVWDEVRVLPLTRKHSVRDDPTAFVASDAKPVYVAETTGTTGRPTRVHFSAYELALMRDLGVIGFMLANTIEPDDVLIMATSPRALGNMIIGSAATRIGAAVRFPGVVNPSAMLAALSSSTNLRAKKGRPSLLSTYPSYLGALIEAGLTRGYKPRDFGLERIFTGGELLTASLKERTKLVFGEVAFIETYAMTETLPFGGQFCRQGHLHFDPTHGLIELCDPTTGAEAAPGEKATLVATPFPPYRDTTLLLRYDTEDVVCALAQPPDCEKHHLPAASAPWGKLAACTLLANGRIVTPREVAEVLEASVDVPLPARYAMSAWGDRIVVDVVVRDPHDAAVKAKFADKLADEGVPIAAVRLVDHPSNLPDWKPLRADLREPCFPIRVAS